MLSTTALNVELNETLKNEIETIEHLRQLDIKKQLITEQNKQKEKGYRKGFSSNFHNYQRDKNVYSVAELQFKELLDLFNIEYVHEFKVKVRDIKGKYHFYHLDFYLPKVKLCIEINPLFHYTYEIVRIRDKLRANLLKRKLNIKTIDIKVYMKQTKKEKYVNIDYTKALNTIEKILKMQCSKETLLNYMQKQKKRERKV